MRLIRSLLVFVFSMGMFSYYEAILNTPLDESATDSRLRRGAGEV